ncbi:DNA repair putative endonuclease MmcB [Brevundimonas sp.]|uniref:DNA repair putative endonuclease MmcB n=1 Tax=Brevundimonas sp. TaxID=1871086 RepID=UPI003568B23F
MSAAAVHIELVFSRPETTLSVTRGAARLMVDLGYAPLLEVGLPNGRRADVMALGPRGDIVICEVKSGLDDYRVDRKWGEYGPFCDAFYFAVAPEFPSDILPDHPGLIVADGFGGAVVRDAPLAPLAPARRKALTIAFARLGALRTLRHDPTGQAGG